MADTHMMEEMPQAPTEGYGDAIVVPDILAKFFEIKTDLLSLIQANQFHGFESNNPHDHIKSFNRITSTLKFRDVPNDAIKLMLFPFSLEGAAKIWYEKEPPRSILTWGGLNEITRFTQKFEETFGEAWERFKEMLRQCPHHGFSKLHQIDTFYNGLNEHEQDSLNAAAGGNLLRKTLRDALTIIENKSKLVAFKVGTASSGNSSSTDSRIDKLMDTISNLVETFNKKMTTPAMVKVIEETCVIYGGAHPYYDCIATDSNILSACATTGTYNQGNTRFRLQVATNYRANQISPPGFPPVQNNQNRFNQNQGRGNNFNQAPTYQAPTHQPQVVTQSDFQAYIKGNDAVMKNMQTQMTSLTNSNIELKSMFHQFMKMNNASSSGSGSLPSNTVPNPREDLKAITTRSGVTLVGPSVSPPPPSKEVDQEPKTITDHVLTGSTNNVPPSVVQPSPASTSSTHISSPKIPESNLHQPLVAQIQVPIDEPVVAPKPKLTYLILVDYVVDPRVPLILERPFLRTGRALIDVYGEELTLHVNDEAITFKVGQTSKYSYNDAESINRLDVIDVACEEYVQEVLGFSDNSKRSDFILEEIKTFLRIPDELSNLDDNYYDTEGDILYLAKLLNEDLSPNLPLVKTEDLKQVDATMTKPSIEEPPELELKELLSHLEYAFLEGTDKLPVITSKELKDEEKSALLKVLKSHKRAIAWKIFDIKDGFSEYFQMSIDPQDQEKTTFTCPYGRFAYQRMPFSLCNAPGTFQRCMMAIFHDMIEKMIEEKCHFMVKERIVLGHKISKSGIEVDKAKVDVIAKLPHLNSVKAGSESRPHMLNKENYVPWSSRLLRYAKSRPNGKLIHNSIINGPYVRKMITEPGDANRKITVTETFHLQTDDELSDKELKQIEADDQAIQTILLGLPRDIYAAVDSCETAQEIWLRVQQMMKGSDIRIQEKKAKISSNLRNMQIAQPGMNMGQDRQMQRVGGNVGNQFRQYAGQNARNPAREWKSESDWEWGIGHYARNCTVRPRKRVATYLQTQLLIAQKEE
nr:reverse transcriptase domain-containing protein [Tanacetum cinerariifolium]